MSPSTQVGPRHRSRKYRPARRRFGGTAVWLIIGGAAAAIVSSGFVVGAFVIGSFGSSPHQSSVFGAPTAPPGLSYVAAQAEIVSPSTTPAAGACVTSNLGTIGTPTLLVNGTTTAICLSTNASGFTTGDTMYTFEVSFSHLAANATIFELQFGVDVTPGANDIVATSYVETSVSIVNSENATFAVDMTESGDTSLVQYGILVTQL
ncbi:MAG TPA: hypothetical protein VMG36_04505 [Thermoplasmata archaeon]|nr:hypothetical protein [Thermoplasmata archaeon]